MAQPVEIILARQLAGHLAIPMFIVDPEGALLFYNEPAERVLGRRFDETGKMPMEEWATVFDPTDEEGGPIPPEELPLVATLRDRRPAYKRMTIIALDGTPRQIEVSSMPLLAQGNRFVGAVAILWEVT